MDLPPNLGEAVMALSPEEQVAFVAHLDGGTSAEWLSSWLRRRGTPVSATTIRTHRRALKTEGRVQV